MSLSLLLVVVARVGGACLLLLFAAAQIFAQGVGGAFFARAFVFDWFCMFGLHALLFK
jgi:hypothetical protein